VTDVLPHVRERAFGRSVPRREDWRLLVGAGRFVDDVPHVDALEAAFLRSPFAHGRVIRLDVAAAAAVPGVAAMVAPADVPLGPLHPR
jgi:CO/xanthine dehydrogenase Mo-binding subunit